MKFNDKAVQSISQSGMQSVQFTVYTKITTKISHHNNVYIHAQQHNGVSHLNLGKKVNYIKTGLTFYIWLIIF